MLGAAGRAGGSVCPRAQARLAPLRCCRRTREELRVGPWARLWGWQVPATRVAGAPWRGRRRGRSERRDRPCQAGQQPQAWPARVPGVPPFRAWWGPWPGGQGQALAAMPKCGWGGQKRLRLSAVLTRLTKNNIASVHSDAADSQVGGKLTYCSLWGTRL